MGKLPSSHADEMLAWMLNFVSAAGQWKLLYLIKYLMIRKSATANLGFKLEASYQFPHCFLLFLRLQQEVHQTTERDLVSN